MQKYKQAVADKALEKLRGKPLIKITNEGGELYLGFGEMVETGFYGDNNKKVPEYILKIVTQFRFTLDTEIILGKQDLFWAGYDESRKEDFNITEVNLNDGKTTRFFEQIRRFFNKDVIEDYVVKDVRAGKMGDFLFIFKNGARLEVTSDAFGLPISDENYEMWRLFKSNDLKSDFAVTPLGIAEKGELGRDLI